MRPFLQRMKRIVLWLRTGWCVLGVTLFLVLVLELGLQGLFWLNDLRKPQRPPDPRVLGQVVDGPSWLNAHYRELERLSDRWQPYVYFRQRAFQGQTINIDVDGRRRTWEPPGDSDPSKAATPPIKILTLGGSSLWGFGARDDRTIPSLMAREFHKRGIRAQITNMAEIGYVNTQELIALVRELQTGYRPDLVLFYDGVNDTTSALLEGRATVTTNEINRVREFNLLQSPARLATALGSNLIKNSSLFRFARSASGRLGLSKESQVGPRSQSELDHLAEEVVKGYTANLKLIEVLGKAYGFQPIFVWQPAIFAKPHLVPFEQEESQKYAWASGLFGRVRVEIERSTALTSNPAFVDLSGIFDHTESLAFLDFCHTTEEANAKIATELVSKILKAGLSPERESAGR
jgi:hypothetical protein